MPVSWQIGRRPSAHMRELVRICAMASFAAAGLLALVGAPEGADVVRGMVVGDELQRVGDALHQVVAPDRRSCVSSYRAAGASGIRRSLAAMAIADSRNVMWMPICAISVFSSYAAALMNVLSRWIEEMPMIAVASLTFEHRRVDVRQPFRLVGMPLQMHARDEGFVAADDHHDEQVGDHHHVDQAEHDQHDDRLVQLGRRAPRLPPSPRRGCGQGVPRCRRPRSSRCTSSCQKSHT